MLTPFPARAEILFQPGRVVDTSTGLVWLNVWEADAFVRQLGDVAGGWRHATDDEVDALLAHAEGRSPGPGFGFGLPLPFSQTVADVILTLEGETRTLTAPFNVEGVGFSVSGWYRHGFIGNLRRDRLLLLIAAGRQLRTRLARNLPIGSAVIAK